MADDSRDVWRVVPDEELIGYYNQYKNSEFPHELDIASVIKEELQSRGINT